MIGSHQISEPRPTESALLHENGSNNNETDVALTSPPPMSANALNNVCLAVRFIRFGTYCTVPYKEGLVMESSCLILTVKEDSSVYANFPCTTQADSTSAPHLVTSRPYAFKIGWHNVRRFEFHVHANCSVIYLLMSDNCAKKIRETFGLNEQFVHDFRLPFYDPGSNEQGRKYVTIGLSECRVSWIDIVRKYIYKVNPQAEVVALTYKEAMDRMRKSAPAVRNVLPHQPHRAGLGQQQQQIVQKSTSPPILNTFVQRHANGDGGNVANIGVPVYQIQSPVVRQVPLVPIQIQQYAVANVFYQPANFVTSRAINNNNINASINNPIVNVNRATNMTYSEAYSKVQKGLMNDHSSPQKQQQYCQQDASTSTSIDMAESPVMQSSFGQQICNLTATTATVTTPSTTSKHFLQNIVLKVFKKIRNNDGTEIPVVPRATAPVDVSWPQLEIRRQQNEQQLQISDSYESQQSSTSSLQHSQAISDFLLDVPENFELIYPLTSKKSDSITLTFNDVSCLEPDAFLNDNIIDFFLKYVHQELVADDLRDRIYIFNSFFYSRLTSRSNSFNNASNVDQPSTIGVGSAVAKKGEVSSSAVDTKNRRVSSSLDPNYAFEAEDEDEEDIEEAKEQYEQLKDASMSDSSSTQSQIYQLIPAMTCIIIMDSLLCGSPRYRTVGILRDYLTEEYAQKKNARQPKPQDDQQTNTTMPIFDRTNCRGIYPKVPQQDNYSDCGLYVLQFAESFLTEPPDDFGPTGLKKLQNLFPSEKVKNKRAEIRDILVRFFKNRTDRNSSKAEEASKSEILP